MQSAYHIKGFQNTLQADRNITQLNLSISLPRKRNRTAISMQVLTNKSGTVICCITPSWKIPIQKPALHLYLGWHDIMRPQPKMAQESKEFTFRTQKELNLSNSANLVRTQVCFEMCNMLIVNFKLK